MRAFHDDEGNRWQVVLGKESWGTLVLLFTPDGAGESRTSVLGAETMLAASAELDAMTDDDLRARLRDSRPWT
ncbi:MAG TPA: hypothetical protein VGP25_15995 [Gemmatimonadaceae bacterium]|jgi:hypothetical protein|nr:hypothetical protein [Gemmatimonadaceae bacterium]